MTAEFNIRALAAEIIADSSTPDPGVMAEDLVARIAPEDYRGALLALARGYVREVIRNQRNATNGGGPSVGSHKVAAARDAWKRLLNTPEFVPSVGWVFLRDATHTQVLEMAGERRKKSVELRAAADRYARIAAEMQTRSVLRVSDLSEDVLAPLLDQTGTAA